MADAPPTSFRLPVDVLAALRQRGEETGESVSDMLRQGALMVLGICPTCGQKAPEPTDAGHEGEHATTGGEAA